MAEVDPKNKDKSHHRGKDPNCRGLERHGQTESFSLSISQPRWEYEKEELRMLCKVPADSDLQGSPQPVLADLDSILVRLTWKWMDKPSSHFVLGKKIKEDGQKGAGES